MGNVFDFQLNADENATKALAEIEARLKHLNPLLNSTRDGLRLGGSETLENTGSLSIKLREMSRHAQDNVQNIGDMIPPLKMFGELSGKYLDKGLKLGGIGAIGYGITKMGQKLNEQSKEAYNLNVMAKNNNMTPEEFSRISGAMVILGADADKAKESVDGLYKIFNDPLWARNDAALAQLNSMGVSIIRKEDGTADVSKTMEELAKVFPTYSSAKQKTIADFLGLDANTLALLREGAKYKQLLAKSDTLGLTVPNELNQKLTDLNGTINELNASWEGFKQRASNATANFLTSDGSVNDGLKGVSDLLQHGLDNFAITRTLGFTRGDESDQLRWGYNNPEFYNTLSTYEKTMLDFGLMTDGYKEKYDKWPKEKKVNEKIEPPEVPEQKNYKEIYNTELKPVKKSGKQPRGIRNNNPGNLIAAPNATGEDFGNNGYRYVKFGSAHDGISAMARQLMLDAERGLNDITSLLYKYAGPKGGNDTQAYIDFVSQRTGYAPNQPLNLHDPDVLANVMREMINMENNKINPYSDEQMRAGINDAIHSNRWAGLRNPQILKEQRYQYPIDNAVSNEKTPQSEQTSKELPPQRESNQTDGINTVKKEDNKAPSLYGKKEGTYTKLGVEMAEGMAKAVKDAFGDSPLKLEITLVNDKTGERQKLQTKTAGKVTTAMSYS